MSESIVKSGHIAVLYGGSSLEREVSLESGRAVYDALKQGGLKCTLIDTANDTVAKLQAAGPDCAFIALHGADGENGTMQGLLETMEIPYTGSGVNSSALAMDKYRSKLLWRGLGLPTPDFTLVTSADHLPVKYPFPCFVKATCQGSTIGTFPVSEQAQLKNHIEKALTFSSEVILEKWIKGREFAVPVLHGSALPAICIEPASGFYDYEAKYLLNTTQYHIPCGLSTQREKELQTLALEAFTAIGCSGWGRVDFMEDGDGKFWLIEVNTIPGMTETSLMPKAAKVTGMDFQALVFAILETASGNTISAT